MGFNDVIHTFVRMRIQAQVVRNSNINRISSHTYIFNTSLQVEKDEMAMVRAQHLDENTTRLPGAKAVFKPQAAKTAKPRAALGTICTNLTERNAFLQGVKQKEKSAVAPREVKPVLPTAVESELPTIVELAIEDIDAFDIEDPQLCCEYVKDIYKYMEKLEVSC